MKSAWGQGFEAAKQGKEAWECPYALPSDSLNDFLEWMRGWCMGNKLKAQDGNS